jgi:hypothetical protein
MVGPDGEDVKRAHPTTCRSPKQWRIFTASACLLRKPRRSAALCGVVIGQLACRLSIAKESADIM